MPDEKPRARLEMVAPTPSEQIIAEAQRPQDILDESGRKIRLRKPSPLAQFRFIEMLGKNTENPMYVGMALPLMFVTRIDEDDVDIPSSKRELEALIKQLDEPGLKAVSEGVAKHFGGDGPGDAADRDRIKN